MSLVTVKPQVLKRDGLWCAAWRESDLPMPVVGKYRTWSEAMAMANQAGRLFAESTAAFKVI